MQRSGSWHCRRQAIKARLLQFCGRHAPQVIPAALVTLPLEQPAATEPGPTEDEIREDDLYPAQVDTEDRFAALECEHTEKLHEADQVEQQGLTLLRKAALLHAAITCDNRGDTFVGTELRELAESLDSDPTNEAPVAAVVDSPVLRLIAARPPAPGAA
jgi:hypothetical protein